MISELKDNVEKDKASLGGVLVDWETACAGFSSLSGVSRVEKQNGYHAESEWGLKISSDLHPVDWFMTSEDDNVMENWSKLLTPISRTLSKALDPSYNRSAVMVALPPMASEKQFPEWDGVFIKSKMQSTDLFISDIGSIIAKKKLKSGEGKGKRIYLINVYQNDNDTCEACSITGYEEGLDGTIINTGSLGYKPLKDQFIDMKIVERNNISLGEHAIAEHIKQEMDFMWSPVEIKFYNRMNKKFFLSRQSPYFGLDYWNAVEAADAKNESQLAKAIFKVIKENGAQTVEAICSKMTNCNPSKIALEDLIAVAIELKENPVFTKSSLSTTRELLLGSTEIPVESWLEDVIGMIPCNYYNFEWKTKKPSGYLGTYYNINTERINMETLISVIVDHFDHCTTATVADELLAFFNVEGDPSAYFTVQVFLYLSNCSNLVLASQMSYSTIETQ